MLNRMRSSRARQPKKPCSLRIFFRQRLMIRELQNFADSAKEWNMIHSGCLNELNGNQLISFPACEECALKEMDSGSWWKEKRTFMCNCLVITRCIRNICTVLSRPTWSSLIYFKCKRTLIDANAFYRELQNSWIDAIQCLEATESSLQK